MAAMHDSFSAPRRALISALLAIGILLATAASAKDDAVQENLHLAHRALTDMLSEDTVAGYTSVLSGEDAVAPALAGQVAFTHGAFLSAGWFYTMAARRAPGDATLLNNAAATLTETHYNLGDDAPADLLRHALDLARAATELAPENAAVHNTRGKAARLLAGQAEDAAELRKESVAAHRRAVSLAPDEPLYRTNLARALAAAGAPQEAADTLQTAHDRSPAHPAVSIARSDLARDKTFANAYRAQSRPYCDAIDFRCADICPVSLTGGVRTVNCGIANEDAKKACRQGRPYPESYDCKGEFPKYGILIPFLNSGLTVTTPVGKLEMVYDGDGNFDIKMTGSINAALGAAMKRAQAAANTPVSGGIGFDASFSPSDGFSFTEFRAGLRYSLINNTRASDTAGGLGFHPAHLDLGQAGGDTKIAAGAFGAAVISN